MAGFDYTIASSIVKRIYDDKDTVSQMQDQAPYIKARKKVPADLGAGLYSSIQTARNQSIGIRNSGGTTDGEALPSVSQPAFSSPTWDTVRNYIRIYVSGKAVSRTTSKDRSFAAGIAYQVADSNKAYWRDKEGMCFNGVTSTSGKSGCRGILDNSAYTAGTATLTLDVTTSALHRRFKGCKNLYPGMKLDIYNDTAWTKSATFTVTSVNGASNTITGTLSDNLAGTATEWYLFREGDFNREVNGLIDIVDDGSLTASLGGVTTSGLWAGHVLGNSGTLRDLTVSLLDEAILLSMEENDIEPAEMWMNYSVYRKLLELHQRTTVLQKQVGSSKLKANLGGEIEMFDTAAIKRSSLVAPHSIVVLQPNDIVILEQEAYKPLAFGQENGREVFWRFVPGYDAWEAVFVHEWTQKTHRRNLHVMINDITQ